ncbi:phage baseplate assembly protein W [Salmonella enterica subsp. enterica]|uniref:Phage baseplate assembly protein W n=1 Tax=Salmonella enterica I TaxID=59201 RepID=A0A3S4FEP7_SALET|nr:phage baseplate assembly protein W [Salmonella enterica subsp. enterica]
MTLYIGMSRNDGQVIADTDHLRQSVRDILLTPQGSRLARREYGSLLSALIDQPQNPALWPADYVCSLCGAEPLGAAPYAGLHHHQRQF